MKLFLAFLMQLSETKHALFENKLKTILLCTLKVRLFLVFMQRIFWWKGKHAEFKIKSCLEIKYEINTDLPSARAHYFKSVEPDFSIAFVLNMHHPILEMDKVDCTSYRRAIMIFLKFWLGGRLNHFFSFSFYQGFIQSSPSKILITSILNLSQRLTLMDLRNSYRG